MSNEELDKLFKNKLDSREVPFDEGAWEDALQLINANEKKGGKGIIIWLVIAATILVAGAGYWYATTLNTDTTEITQTKNTNKNNINTPTQQQDLEDNSYGEADVNNKNTSTENVNEDMLPPHQDKGKATSTSKQPPLPDEGNNPIPAAQQARGGDMTGKELKTPDAGQASAGSITDGGTKTPASTMVTSKNTEKEPLPNKAEGLPKLMDNTKTEKREFSLINSSFSAASALPVNYLVDFKYLPDSLFVDSDGSDAIDNSEQADSMEEEIERKPKPSNLHFYKHSLGLAVGTAYVKGLQNNQPVQAADTYSPLIGLGYTYGISGRFSVDINGFYYTRKGLNSTLDVNNVTYGFGFDSMQIQEETKSLSFFNLPILANYRITHRHSVQVGGGISWLLNSESVFTQTQRGTFDSTRSAPITTTEKGYREGFNSINYNLIIGYRYTISNRLSIDLRANLGLNDMTINRIYNNTTFDRNLQYRILLRYDIFKANNDGERKD